MGVTESEGKLQELINMVHAYCRKWWLKANVSKSAVMVFARDQVVGKWKWGDRDLPTATKYTYLGVDFTSLGGAYKESPGERQEKSPLISNRDIIVSARRILFLPVV